jgi:hypothetical protein
MSQNTTTVQALGQTGQVASFAELQRLVFDFESVLRRFSAVADKATVPIY